MTRVITMQMYICMYMFTYIHVQTYTCTKIYMYMLTPKWESTMNWRGGSFSVHCIDHASLILGFFPCFHTKLQSYYSRDCIFASLNHGMAREHIEWEK